MNICGAMYPSCNQGFFETRQRPVSRIAPLFALKYRPGSSFRAALGRKVIRFTFTKCNSYGLVLGTGAGLVRETASLVLGNYFRKRREFVEMVMQAGTGVGIVLFSVVYKEAVG